MRARAESRHGFFWSQRFLIGGETYSLHDIENDIIRKNFSDPRIHFALNCASGSCPPLRPDLPTGAELEPYLQAATHDCLSDPRNVSVDHEALARRGIPKSARSLHTWIEAAAPVGGELRRDLTRAAEYEIAFASYDWSLNGG